MKVYDMHLFYAIMEMYESFYKISLRTLSTLLEPYPLCDLCWIYVNWYFFFSLFYHNAECSEIWTYFLFYFFSRDIFAKILSLFYVNSLIPQNFIYVNVIQYFLNKTNFIVLLFFSNLAIDWIWNRRCLTSRLKEFI